MPQIAAYHKKLLAEFCNTINKTQRMGGGTGKPEIDMILVEEAAINGGTIDIEATRDSLRATYHKDLRLGDRVVADVKGLGHILGDRTCEDKTVGMAR